MVSFHCSMSFVIGHNRNRQSLGDSSAKRGSGIVGNWNRCKGLFSTWIADPSEGKGIRTFEAVVKTDANHRPHRQRSKGDGMHHLIAARNRPTASVTTANIEFWTPAALSSSAIHNRPGASLKCQTLRRPPAGFDSTPFTHAHPPDMQSRGPFPQAPSLQPNHVSIQHHGHSTLSKEPHSWSLCPRSGCVLALSLHTPRFRGQIKPPGHQPNGSRAPRNQHRVASHHDKISGGLPHGSGGSHSVTERPTLKTSLSCCPVTVSRSARGVRMSLVLLPIVLNAPCSGTVCFACAFAATGTLTGPRRTCQAWSSKRPRLGGFEHRAQGRGRCTLMCHVGFC